MMGWLRERVKAALDRRYLTRDEGARLIGGATSEAQRAAAFVADLDPHELRKKLFEAHRLAIESARAIELILQTEVMMWREIDRVAQGAGVSLDTADRLL